MIPVRIFFKNEVYKSIVIARDDNGDKYFHAKGGPSYKVIELGNIDIEANPFQELITIFRKQKIDDTKVCDWIQSYGFFDTSYGGPPHPRRFNYNWFVTEAEIITDLWIKYNEIRSRDIEALKTWLKPGPGWMEDFYSDAYNLQHPSCSLYPCADKYDAKGIENGEFTTRTGTLSFNKRKEDLDYRDYQHSGLRYILLKITLRIKNIAFDYNDIKGTDETDADLSSFVIENSIIVPPDLLTALYLYFFQLLHSNVRICPVCLKPFSDRRPDAIACSATHSNTFKKRKQRANNQNKKN